MGLLPLDTVFVRLLRLGKVARTIRIVRHTEARGHFTVSIHVLQKIPNGSEGYARAVALAAMSQGMSSLIMLLKCVQARLGLKGATKAFKELQYAMLVFELHYGPPMHRRDGGDLRSGSTLVSAWKKLSSFGSIE